MSKKSNSQADICLIIRDQRGGKRYFVDNAFLRDGWGALVGPYGIAIYSCLCLHADSKDQSAHPSHRTMAELTGMSQRQATRMINELQKYNLIAVEPRYGNDGRRTSDLVTLLHPSQWRRPEQSSPPMTHSHGPHDSQSPPPMTHSHGGHDSQSPHEQNPSNKPTENKTHHHHEPSQAQQQPTNDDDDVLQSIHQVLDHIGLERPGQKAVIKERKTDLPQLLQDAQRWLTWKQHGGKLPASYTKTTLEGFMCHKLKAGQLPPECKSPLSEAQLAAYRERQAESQAIEHQNQAALSDAQLAAYRERQAESQAVEHQNQATIAAPIPISDEALATIRATREKLKSAPPPKAKNKAVQQKFKTPSH